jgi:hypothetical protein
MGINFTSPITNTSSGQIIKFNNLSISSSFKAISDMGVLLLLFKLELELGSSFISSKYTIVFILLY